MENKQTEQDTIPEWRRNGYDGLCPKCHLTDGCLNIGRDQWGFCKEHKTRWHFGSNVYSSWRDEPEDQQHRQYEDLGMGSFETVEGFYIHLQENTPGKYQETEEERQSGITKHQRQEK